MQRDAPPPYGFVWTPSGSTFCVAASPKATAVELCLFPAEDSAWLAPRSSRPAVADGAALGSLAFSQHSSRAATAKGRALQSVEVRIELQERLGSRWWITGLDVELGTRYGVRVHGPGHDPDKLLVDPWARALDGTIDWSSSPGAMQPGSGLDSVGLVPLGVVTDRDFDWGDDRRPEIAWTDTTLYEIHVKGATKQHPEVPAHLQGTYAGFAHPAFVAHLKRLGVSSVELLPIHHIGDEERLAALGLTNYWGYNTLGFFAPHQAYAADRQAGGQVREVKQLVKTLHQEGLEVILDVVYNHTCEGGSGGAAISLRGLHGDSLYRRFDTTGCGNTLDITNPLVLAMVLDSCRMWVEEYHVDGFRFDLASALCRGPGDGFDFHATFLAALGQDPVLSTVKLIAEPWDIGADGYQLGSFPAPWAEWNDRYRSVMRDHWRGAPSPLGAFARRLTGNEDIFAGSGRRPWSSINFVTAHDGFTLVDLLSYNDKHNEVNGERNHDGSNDNRSWNHGHEGLTDDPLIVLERRRAARAILATLLLSQGTPMLLAGDEMGRTQHGNNNAYCQDNDISWLDWEHADQELIDFVALLLRFRKDHPTLRSKDWLHSDEAHWFSMDGKAMTVDAWNNPDGDGLTLVLAGKDGPDLAIVMHEGLDAIDSALPAGAWRLVISSEPGWVPPAPHDEPVTVSGARRIGPFAVEVFEAVGVG